MSLLIAVDVAAHARHSSFISMRVPKIQLSTLVWLCSEIPEKSMEREATGNLETHVLETGPMGV